MCMGMSMIICIATFSALPSCQCIQSLAELAPGVTEQVCEGLPAGEYEIREAQPEDVNVCLLAF